MTMRVVDQQHPGVPADPSGDPGDSGVPVIVNAARDETTVADAADGMMSEAGHGSHAGDELTDFGDALLEEDMDLLAGTPDASPAPASDLSIMDGLKELGERVSGWRYSEPQPPKDGDTPERSGDGEESEDSQDQDHDSQDRDGDQGDAGDAHHQAAPDGNQDCNQDGAQGNQDGNQGNQDGAQVAMPAPARRRPAALDLSGAPSSQAPANLGDLRGMRLPEERRVREVDKKEVADGGAHRAADRLLFRWGRGGQEQRLTKRKG